MANPRSFISFDFDHNETEKSLLVQTLIVIYLKD